MTNLAEARRRPRVVFNGRFLGQMHTGVQRYALETLRAFDRLLESAPALCERCDFELALPQGAPAPALKYVRAVVVGRGAGHLWEQGALLYHSRGAYLVNFNYSGPVLKRHQLITVHDATVKAMPQAFNRTYRWVHNSLVAVLGRTAQDLMTVSRFSSDELRRWFGLRREHIIVGREGGEHAVHDAGDDAAVLARHGLQPGCYFLGVGSLKPNKNFRLLAQALALMDGGHPWPVAIAGAKDLSIFSDVTALPGSFRLLGFVDDHQLSALYRNAAWFVFPSLYEGFGLPAVEAMAHGCPVLAARAASIPEVCDDAALYFDPESPQQLAALMKRVHQEPALREPVVAAGLLRLRLYNWQANAEILMDHLKRRLRPRDRAGARPNASPSAKPVASEIEPAP